MQRYDTKQTRARTARVESMRPRATVRANSVGNSVSASRSSNVDSAAVVASANIHSPAHAPSEMQTATSAAATEQEDSEEALYSSLVAAVSPFAEATRDLINFAQGLSPSYPQIRVWAIPLRKFLLALTEMPETGNFRSDLATYAERLEGPTREVITIGEATAQTMPAQVRGGMLQFVDNCRGLLVRLAHMQHTLS